MKWFITGDKHLDLSKIDFVKIPKNSGIIILGDHMFSSKVEWNKQEKIYELTESGKYILKSLEKIPVTFFCIQGGNDCPVSLIKGNKEVLTGIGAVLQLPYGKNVFFAKNGEIYNFEKKKVLVCGGASCPTEKIRKNAHDKKDDELVYFPEVENETLAFLKSMPILDHDVKILFSHTCPKMMLPSDFYKDNKINVSGSDTETALDSLYKNNPQISDIYCGYFHIDACKKYKDTRVHYLYDTIEEF